MKKLLVIIITIALIIVPQMYNGINFVFTKSKLSIKEEIVQTKKREGKGQINKTLSLSDFKFLKLGMKYNEIVKRVGRPSGTMGSGILMYFYNLKDQSRIILNFGFKVDGLVLVMLMDKHGKTVSLLEKKYN